MDLELSEYERIRADNIARNQEFLKSIGMDEVTTEIAQHQSKSGNKSDPTSRGVSKRKVLAIPVQPARRSSRVTIERLKSEDLSTLSQAEREKKEEELKNLIAAKAAASYAGSIMLENFGGAGDEEKYSRLPETPIPAIPPYNQPQVGDYRDKNGNIDEALIEEEKNSAEYKDWGQPILQSLRTLSIDMNTKQREYTSSEEFLSRMRKLQIASKDVAKVTENRVTSVWIHPATSKLLVAGGDKSGYFGLWDVDATEIEVDQNPENSDDEGNEKEGNRRKRAKTIQHSSQNLSNSPLKTRKYGNRYESNTGVGGVWKYRPHVGAIARIFCYPKSPESIYTVSYDGTVRMLDLHTESFIQKFEAPEGVEDMWFTDACEHMDVHANRHVSTLKSSPLKAVSSKKPSNKSNENQNQSNAENLLYVSRSDGFISLIDFRTSTKKYAWTCDIGYKVQSIQHWPTDENLLLTANAGMGTSSDTDGNNGYSGLLNIWDIRMLYNRSSTKGVPPAVVTFSGHSKSINAAYASPDGNYVLSVSQDSTIRCWAVGDALRAATGVVNESTSPVHKSAPTATKKTQHSTTTVQKIPFNWMNHDNHTGRWLSTFRPIWDPKSPHSFLLGSMGKPRCLELFDIMENQTGSTSKWYTLYNFKGESLASVVSRNAVHPTLDIIAAANSSGRIHVFR